MRHLPAGESPDDAETFQEVCTFISRQARKVRFHTFAEAGASKPEKLQLSAEV